MSLHAASGGASWQAALFVVAGVAALSLALGYRTRLATIVTWALLTSLHARDPLVLYRGDAVLRLMLFFAIALPLGARASVDSRRASGRAGGADSFAGGEARGFACFAAAAQLAAVYVVGLAHKSGATWREGTAVYYALQLDGYATDLGRALGRRPSWSPALTYGTLALEALAPLLLLVPWRRPALRLGAASAAFALHLGLLATMRLGLFTWVMFACWALFLPPPFWDACARAARRWRETPAATMSEGEASPVVRAHGPVVGLLLGATLVAIGAWNVGDLRGDPPEALGRVLRPLGLAQRWSMFSPDPARDDGWIVVAARLADGRELDVLNENAPAGPERPPPLDLRWRSYLSLVARDGEGALTEHLAAWACSRAPGAEHVTILFEEERTMPPGTPPERDTSILRSAPCAAATR